MIWCIKTYIIAYVKTQKNKIYYPLCQIYSLTVIFVLKLPRLPYHPGLNVPKTFCYSFISFSVPFTSTDTQSLGQWGGVMVEVATLYCYRVVAMTTFPFRWFNVEKEGFL